MLLISSSVAKAVMPTAVPIGAVDETVFGALSLSEIEVTSNSSMSFTAIVNVCVEVVISDDSASTVTSKLVSVSASKGARVVITPVN